MTFGKNRVQYINKYWKYYRFDRFDTYFYKDGDSLSREVAAIADKKLPEIENFFGYGLQKRLIFLSYKRMSDFRESNIGYDSGNENSNIGGVTQIIDNKVFVFYEEDSYKLEKQIAAGITQVIINDMLYSGSYSRRFANSTLIELPEWYQEGLVSYLSEEWSFQIEDRIKDGFNSGQYKKINHLTGNDAKFAGHSFWYFIGETYGKDVIPNILYMTRINKNSDVGFRYVLGLSVKELTPIWKDFYVQKFSEIEGKFKMPDEQYLIVKGKKDALLNQLKISPDNKKIAYVSNQMGRYKIKIYDKEDEKEKIIRKKGHKLDQITDYSYPVLAWHPTSNILTFFTEELGRLKMYTYNINEKELNVRNILFFDKILSASYSNDGFYLVLSAVKDGKTDIFIYNITAGNYDQITNDRAADLNPKFIEGSQKIIFASDRDAIQTGSNGIKPKELYICDIRSEDLVFRKLTNSHLVNEDYPGTFQKNKYYALTDKTGILSKQIIEYDSVISYIDTSIHYRYFTNEYLLEPYPVNIRSFDINSGSFSIAEVLFKDKRFNIYDQELDIKNRTDDNFLTQYRKKLSDEIKYADSIYLKDLREEELRKKRLDSLRNNPPDNLLHPDSIPVDINNYIFEKDRKIQYYDIHPIRDTINENAESSNFLETFNYLTNFYTNHITQQVDFGFLNNSYQAYTGSAFYFNPGLNIFTKVGIYDLFEDYRVTGGFRLGANFDSYEYLFSLENLKYKIDRQFIYHRQTFVNEYIDSVSYFLQKVYTNELMGIFKYPFDQVSSVKASLTLRHDKEIFLSTEAASLAEPASYQFFSGLKLEYNFDNVRSLGTNLYDGTRFKIFGEYYQEVDQKYTNLFVVGADFRFYKKLHRTLIFASRFAASSSFGKSKLIYYLGGVDNWIVFNPNRPQFDNSVDINQTVNYVYQAVGTNMRGFIQNARNGTSFFVMNNEIRFPIIRYLVNRPLNSSFLNNFQIVGFADAGSAWSGLTPNDDANAYKTETVQTGDVKVIIDKNRWPVVFGYGAGVRSKIFGYFIRLDWAWGIDNNIILPRQFYLSLNLDF